MGDRGQVHITDTDVWLYTHWGRSDLPTLVSSALRRGESRWNDPEYLARIIFSDMVRDDIDGETGYGIGTFQHGDVWDVVEVDCEKQTVTLVHDDRPVDRHEFETFATFGDEAEWPDRD